MKPLLDTSTHTRRTMSRRSTGRGRMLVKHDQMGSTPIRGAGGTARSH